MQATVNVSHTDLQRSVGNHTAHLFKSCGRLIPVVLIAISALFVLLTLPEYQLN